MLNIFVSYSREDSEIAKRFSSTLNNLGYKCWIDVEKIQAGNDWMGKIQEGLDSSDLMLLMMSPYSMKSPQVAKEWKYFLTQKKQILPILIRETTNIQYQLTDLHYVDFVNKPSKVAMNELRSELAKYINSIQQLKRQKTGEITSFDDNETEVLKNLSIIDIPSTLSKTVGRLNPKVVDEINEARVYFDENTLLILTILDGKTHPIIQTKLETGRSYILGRRDESFVPDIDMTAYGAMEYGVSRQHAELRSINENLFLTDLKSRNQTLVNKEELQSGKFLVLRNGDHIQLGAMLIRIGFKQDKP